MITGWQLFALQPVWKVLALQPVWNVLQVKYLHCNQCEKTNENRQKMDLSHNQGLSPDKIIGWELFALHNVCTVFALLLTAHVSQCKVFAKCLHCCWGITAQVLEYHILTVIDCWVICLVRPQRVVLTEYYSGTSSRMDKKLNFMRNARFFKTRVVLKCAGSIMGGLILKAPY